MSRYSYLTAFLLFLFSISISLDIQAQGDDFEKDILSMFDSDVKDIWIHTYVGKINGIHKIKVGLGYNGKVYKGIYQFQSSGTYFFLEGVRQGDILTLQEVNTSDYTTGYLILNKNQTNWEGEWKNLEKNLSLPVSIERKTNSSSASEFLNTPGDDNYEYADFDIRMEWTYPDAKNDKFQKWISGKSREWKRQTKEEIDKIKKGDSGTTARDRFKYEALAWSEVSGRNSDFVSGFFYFQKSWTDRIVVEPFCFDLSKEEHVEIQSMFKEDLANAQIVKETIQVQLADLLLKEDDLVKRWLKESSFRYFSLGDEGLVLNTGFNTIFGSRKIIIPYSELRSISRKSSLIRQMVK